MLWYRLLLGHGRRQTQISRLADNGPGRSPSTRKKISYEQTPVDEQQFLAAHIEFSLIERGQDWFKFAR
jgi:hypothetical protein